jgi:large subunit ribosomal protein L32e
MMNKKMHPKFNVPNFGAKKRKGVKERWRKQRGVDNKKRIQIRNMGASPQISYKNPAQLRGARCDGIRTILVHNMKEMQALIDTHEENTVATIAKPVSTRKRIEMTRLATQRNMRVTNGVYE